MARRNCNPAITYINDPSSTSNTFYNKCCAPSNKNNQIKCEDNNGCVLTVNSACVNYNGNNYYSLNIVKGNTLNQVIDSIVSVINTVNVQSDWLETNPNVNSYIKNKPILATVATTGDYNDLLNRPIIPPTPNLQQVTDIGNVTDNSILITGLNSLPVSGAGLWLASNSTNSFIGAFDFDNPGVDLDLQISSGEFSINGTRLGGSSTIGADNISVLGSTNISLISSGTVDIEVPGTGANVWFRDNSNTGVRVRGGDAVNGDEFVTLNQASSLGLNIYNSDGTLTNNRTVTGNSNSMSFIGVSDFRVQAAAFASFILNDTNFLLTDGVNGTLIGQSGNTQLSTTGNLILWAATNGSSGKSVAIQVGSTAVPLRLTDISNGIAGTFAGRVIGEPAVNSNEFATLAQVPILTNIYNSDGTLTGNRLVDGNTGTLEFHNLEMFRFSGGVTGTQTIGEFSSTISQIVRGTEILSFFDNGISLESQFVSGQILLNAPNVQVTQLFNDGLTPNKFLTTDTVGNMLLDVVTFATGTGISYDPGTATITNTAPDQVVTLTQGSNITITGSYPNFTIAASGGGTGSVTSVGLSSSDITIGGTNPITTSGTITLTLPNINANIGIFNNVTVNAKGQVTAASNVAYITTETDPVANAKTVTLSNGTGISITGGTQTIGANPAFTITNTAPDQTVSLANGTGISVSGTYPNFTITNTAPNTNQSLDQVLTVGNTSTQNITVGNASVSGLAISGGSPAIGKVWTATDNSGNGTWQTPLTGEFVVTLDNLDVMTTNTYTLIPAVAGKRIIVTYAVYELRSFTGSGTQTFNLTAGTNSPTYDNTLTTAGSATFNTSDGVGKYTSFLTPQTSRSIDSTPITLSIGALTPVVTAMTIRVSVKYILLDL